MVNNEDSTIIRFCEVLSVKDDTMGLRIKVKIPYEDGDVKTIDDLPYVFPLLPKMIHVNPKVGECVLVILQNQGENKGNRFFIGPVISQPYFMNNDPYEYSSRSLFNGIKVTKPLPNPEMDPENKGSLLDREDIGLIGRKNCDIALKDQEIRIRCGFKKDSEGQPINTLLYNGTDLAYIQLKYNRMIDNDNKQFNSAINIVADRINLLSHDSTTNFNLGDEKNLITDEEMEKILKNAHPIPYGDNLIMFLKQLIRIFLQHSHPFPMDAPILKQPDRDILSQNLDTFLSKNIKIN